MTSANNNIVWHAHKVDREERRAIKKHKSAVLWFTGLPSSGKSTIANELDWQLNQKGIHTCLLDGDNIRHGLNRDLGFSAKDRKENIRRLAEVAKLFSDAGLLTLAAFISPYRIDREMARNLIGPGEFVEIFVQCPLKTCQERDPKGLYKRAVSGEIENFTGVSDVYEEPLSADIVLNTAEQPVTQCVDHLVGFLCDRKIIR